MIEHLTKQVKTYLGGRGKHLLVEFDGVVPHRAQATLERLQGKKHYVGRLWFEAIE